MKKIFSILAAATLTIGGFTACEDVPAPYSINDSATEGGSTAEGSTILNESFATSLGNFTAINTVGSFPWAFSNGYAQATSYVDTDGDNTKEDNAAESWLISPKMNLSNITDAHVSFDYILRYANANELKTNYQLLISKDYTGTPAEATWTDLDFNRVQGSDWQTWYNSGNVNIPAEFIGAENVTVALLYKAVTKSATWEVKNFKVATGAGDYTGEVPDEGGIKELPFSETFATSLGAFKNYTTDGAGTWICDYSTAKATGYDNTTKVTTAGTYYLVSPEVSLAGQTDAHVSYEYILRYDQGQENQQLYINTAFDEANPANGWVLLNGAHTEGSDWNTFSNADLAIPAEYMGKTVRFAFRYNTNAESGSTWEVKNFAVAAGTPGEATGGDTSGTIGDATAPNGDFENWTNNAPNNWKSACSASSATLSMSKDAHSGSYAVEAAGSSSANKRLAYKELTLPAGTYTMKFYVKAATETGASIRPGYVPVTNGAIGSYVYGDYTNNLTNTEWILVEHSFTLDAETVVCPLVMISKNPGGSVIFDDFTLTDANGTAYIK